MTDGAGGVADCITITGGSRSPGGGSSPMYMFPGALAHFSGGGFNRGMFGGGGVAFYPQAGRNTLPPEDSEDVDRVYSYGVRRSWGRIPTLVAGFSALNFLKLHASASGQGENGSREEETYEQCKSATIGGAAEVTIIGGAVGAAGAACYPGVATVAVCSAAAGGATKLALDAAARYQCRNDVRQSYLDRNCILVGVRYEPPPSGSGRITKVEEYICPAQ